MNLDDTTRVLMEMLYYNDMMDESTPAMELDILAGGDPSVPPAERGAVAPQHGTSTAIDTNDMGNMAQQDELSGGTAPNLDDVGDPMGDDDFGGDAPGGTDDTMNQQDMSMDNPDTGFGNTNQTSEFDIENKRLVKYPSYGTIWGTLKIDKLDIEQKIFYGDTLDILKKGVGHFAGSYFAGESGTIILSAHNSKEYFKNLPKLEIGDKIIITTDYGEFTYEVDNYKIIKDDDIESFKIKNDEEMLILYTCYPTYTLGFKDERYIVYAKLVGEVYED